MILRFSEAVARYRRWVLLAAVVAAAGAVAAAVRSPTEPAGALVATGVVAALALVAGAVAGAAFRWPEDTRFETGSFRTPRSATPVFLVLFLVAAWTFVAEVGGWTWAHGDHDAGWIAAVVLLGLASLPFAAAGWRGYGITLSPHAIHADRLTGTLVIPWTALAAEQAAVTPYRLDLVLAHPAQVARRGLVPRPGRVVFEGTSTEFVAAAIRHYAAHPADRPRIGTADEHRRLVELLAVPSSPLPAAPSRARIAALAAAGVLVFAAAVAGDTLADSLVDRHSVLGYAADFALRFLALLSLPLFTAAFRGLRARRHPERTRPEPTEPEETQPSPAEPRRASWARDVTNGR